MDSSIPSWLAIGALLAALAASPGCAGDAGPDPSLDADEQRAIEQRADEDIDDLDRNLERQRQRER